MGRPDNELLDIYSTELRKACLVKKLMDGVYLSCSQLSLHEYIRACRTYCSARHQSHCIVCPRMLTVAELVKTEGYIQLSRAFNIVSPNIKYTAEKARRRLLKIPLASLCIGDPTKGMSSTIVMEQHYGVDYSMMSSVINGIAAKAPSQNQNVLERESVKRILALAQSDRERECIKYTIFKASGISSSKARHLYGFGIMNERAATVEQAIAEVQQIYKVVEDIASMQDKAALATLGIDVCNSDSSDDETIPEAHCPLTPEMLELCKQTLIASNYNRFNLVNMLEDQLYVGDTSSLSLSLFCELPNLGFNPHQISLIKQSKEAHDALKDDSITQLRADRSLEGFIVTDSECENV